MAALPIEMGQTHQLSLQSSGSNKKGVLKPNKNVYSNEFSFIYTVLKVEIRHDTFSNMN